jgi:hypothetical protein
LLDGGGINVGDSDRQKPTREHGSPSRDGHVTCLYAVGKSVANSRLQGRHCNRCTPNKMYSLRHMAPVLFFFGGGGLVESLTLKRLKFGSVLVVKPSEHLTCRVRTEQWQQGAQISQEYV